MTTQGERTPTPGEGQEGQAGQRFGGGAGAYWGRRLTARRVVGWTVVVGVVVAGGWIITRPTPGDFIPGLGPSSKDATKTPPVVGAPPPRTDPEALNVETYFPSQRLIEMGAYKGRRNGVRRGENCVEAQQDRGQELLKNSGCQAYLTVSFTGQDKPVLSSVTVLRFADQAAAVKAADALKAKPGALAFILPDANEAPAPAAGSAAKPGTEPRVEAVGHYVTVTSSRLPESPTHAPSAPASTPATPAASATAPTPEQVLDEATRAVSYSAGSQFVWM
ncbi:hypothetical protein F7Q99_01640 [Streptomyces kaniharaensis]|uniref:Uncharacterized protein n=1 Tax=Streptomyces kaniharaensis TaxID=212423 RepID=A0A6N7KI12_9ACTN|nr:hypothetical protein [Streptomyces kaniharaensis]MQS11016.1 hypothetical protein [Streptomyces kaniharaensis]